MLLPGGPTEKTLVYNTAPGTSKLVNLPVRSRKNACAMPFASTLYPKISPLGLMATGVVQPGKDAGVWHPPGASNVMNVPAVFPSATVAAAIGPLAARLANSRAEAALAAAPKGVRGSRRCACIRNPQTRISTLANFQTRRGFTVVYIKFLGVMFSPFSQATRFLRIQAACNEYDPMYRFKAHMLFLLRSVWPDVPGLTRLAFLFGAGRLNPFAVPGPA